MNFSNFVLYYMVYILSSLKKKKPTVGVFTQTFAHLEFSRSFSIHWKWFSLSAKTFPYLLSTSWMIFNCLIMTSGLSKSLARRSGYHQASCWNEQVTPKLLHVCVCVYFNGGAQACLFFFRLFVWQAATRAAAHEQWRACETRLLCRGNRGVPLATNEVDHCGRRFGRR